MFDLVKVGSISSCFVSPVCCPPPNNAKERGRICCGLNFSLV